uniref:Guanine nucleotide-binding protein subunit gamma n=1 Tax=Caenorhabditis japonica TaxID=281687 RepID=A0A8R1HXS0_CAEJA
MFREEFTAQVFTCRKPSEMDNIKTTTEQLRNEANIQRKKVSEVSKELLEFCEKNKGVDMLVSGPSDQHNPFQEKKSCSVL